MTKLILSALWAWLKDTQIAKGAATTAVGTSVGFITILGVVDSKIGEVKQVIQLENSQTAERVHRVELYLDQRKELRDFQLNSLKEEIKYIRGSVDAMNATIMTIKQNTDENRRNQRSR